jgi:hypothetical protein
MVDVFLLLVMRRSGLLRQSVPAVRDTRTMAVPTVLSLCFLGRKSAVFSTAFPQHRQRIRDAIFPWTGTPSERNTLTDTGPRAKHLGRRCLTALR